MQSVKSYI